MVFNMHVQRFAGRVEAPVIDHVHRVKWRNVKGFLQRARADTLRWVLAEVRNTPWNERHYYAVDGQQARPLEKAFHVSPFNPMDMVYHTMSIGLNGET